MEMTKRKWLLTSLTALAWSLGSMAYAAPATVTDVVAGNPELSTLAKLISQAGLADSLRSGGPYTVFAPNNAAFKALPPATLDKLADPETLKAVLLHHVLPSAFTSEAIGNTTLKTAAGTSLPLAKAGSFVTVEDAMAVEADIKADNGVVHIIDRVLMPPVKK